MASPKEAGEGFIEKLGLPNFLFLATPKGSDKMDFRFYYENQVY